MSLNWFRQASSVSTVYCPVDALGLAERSGERAEAWDSLEGARRAYPGNTIIRLALPEVDIERLTHLKLNRYTHDAVEVKTGKVLARVVNAERQGEHISLIEDTHNGPNLLNGTQVSAETASNCREIQSWLASISDTIGIGGVLQERFGPGLAARAMGMIKGDLSPECDIAWDRLKASVTGAAMPEEFKAQVIVEFTPYISKLRRVASYLYSEDLELPADLVRKAADNLQRVREDDDHIQRTDAVTTASLSIDEASKCLAEVVQQSEGYLKDRDAGTYDLYQRQKAADAKAAAGPEPLRTFTRSETEFIQS